MRTLEDMISLHVHANCWEMMELLAKLQAFTSLEALAASAQATMTLLPVLNFEDAAKEEGWVENPAIGVIEHPDIGMAFGGQNRWRRVCEAHRIKPHLIEVCEVYFVSSWLAEQLALVGAKVDNDIAGQCVWSRTETGQSLTMDSDLNKVFNRLTLN